MSRLMFGWTDRLLPPEIKKDPRLHMQTRLALFWALPGTIVTMALIAYATTLTSGGFRTLLPFVFGQLVVSASALLLLKPKYTHSALLIMAVITAMMTVYGTYLTGGFNNATIVWFAVVPVVFSLYAGRAAAVIGTVVLLSALFGFWLLKLYGHDFPNITDQTSTLWVVVIGWGVVTTA